jgi:hypothetical protein
MASILLLLRRELGDISDDIHRGAGRDSGRGADNRRPGRGSGSFDRLVPEDLRHLGIGAFDERGQHHAGLRPLLLMDEPFDRRRCGRDAGRLDDHFHMTVLIDPTPVGRVIVVATCRNHPRRAPHTIRDLCLEQPVHARGEFVEESHDRMVLSSTIRVTPKEGTNRRGESG